MKKTNSKKSFTWAVVFAWVFGIAGVSGVMYMLFTSEDYNGMGGAKFDTSFVAKTNDNADDSSNATSIKSDNDSKSLAAENASKNKPAAKKTEEPKTIQTPPVVKKEEPKPAPPVVVKKPEPKPVAPPPVVVKKPEPKPVPVVVKKPEPKPVPVLVVVKKPAPKPIPAIVKTIPAPIAKTTPVVVKKAPAKPVKKAEDKVMSDEELKSLVTRIIQTGDENAIYAKCVQLHRTSSGNNAKTAQQIESYLRSQKFSIAGRETSSADVKGIKVTPGNGCMKVTIGSF